MENAIEYWDLLDEWRQPTGEIHIRGQIVPSGRNHVVVHLCVFNLQGQLLIQQRQSFKQGWSNLWDITVGGSIQAGENSREGITRETFEELGLSLDFQYTQALFTVKGPDYFDDYYIVQAQPPLESLVLQASEVQDVAWADWEMILRLHRENKFIPYSLNLLAYFFELGTGKARQSFLV